MQQRHYEYIIYHNEYIIDLHEYVIGLVNIAIRFCCSVSSVVIENEQQQYFEVAIFICRILPCGRGLLFERRFQSCGCLQASVSTLRALVGVGFYLAGVAGMF